MSTIIELKDEKTLKNALERLIVEPELKPSWRYKNWGKFYELSGLAPLKREISVSELWKDPLSLTERLPEIADMVIESRENPDREDLKVRIIE